MTRGVVNSVANLTSTSRLYSVICIIEHLTYEEEHVANANNVCVAVYAIAITNNLHAKRRNDVISALRNMSKLLKF